MPLLSLHVPHIHFHADNNKNLRYLYVLRIIRDITNKTAYLFLPVYLFTVGSETHVLSALPFSVFQKGMMLIGLYYLICRLVSIAFAFVSGNMVSSYGYQKTFALSYVIRVMLFVTLFASSNIPELLFVAAALDGIQTSFFWNSYHTLLSESTHTKNLAEDLSIVQFLLQVGSAVTPALSGLIGAYMGLEYTFLIAIFGPFLGLGISHLLHETKNTDEVSVQEFKLWMKEPQFIKLAGSIAGKYLTDAAIFLWPLYVYFVFGAVDKAGYLYTVALLLAAVVTALSGMYLDTNPSEKSVRPYFASGGFLAALWLIRSYAFQPWGIAVIDMFDKVTSNFHSLFFETSIMKRGSGSQALSFFVYREVISCMAGVVFWIIFLVVFSLTDDWSFIFACGAVGMLLTLLVSDRKV